MGCEEEWEGWKVKKMRIYVDIDDVLCETAKSLTVLAARAFGRHVPYERISHFNLQETFGLTDAEMARFVELSHDPACLMSYAPTPGAVGGVKSLRAAGHAVDIVTGRPAFSYAATESWLASVGLGDFAVTYVNKYGRTFRHEPGEPRTVTLPELRARRYDVAIDDSPVVLEALGGWAETRVFVFTRPWNRSLALVPNMTRVMGWPIMV